MTASPDGRALLRPDTPGVGPVSAMRGTIIWLMVALAIAAALVAASALTAGLLAGWLSDPTEGNAVSRLFIERWRSFVRPEPVERAAYLAGVAAAVPAALVGVFAARRITRAVRWTPAAVASASVVFVLLVLPFVVSDFLPLIFSGGPRGHGGLLATLGQGLVFTTALITAWLLSQPARPGQGLDHRSNDRRVNLVLLAVAIFYGLSVRIKPINLGADLHFNAVFYAVTQVFAGKTVNADLPAQYGMYPELLYPLFRLTGLSVLKFTVVMTLLQAIGLVALLGACIRLVRLAWLRVLAFLTLCIFAGSLWMAMGDTSYGREYYQIWPIRFLFPAVSLFLFVRLRRRGMGTGQVALLAAAAGLAVVWNIDSGVPVFGGLVAYLLARTVFGPTAERKTNLGLLVLGGTVPLAVIALYVGYLTVKAGGDIDWGQWLKYQQIFYSSGFGMLPMPLYPHPWMVTAGLYLFALVLGILGHVRRRPSVATDALLYLGVLGIGLFTYYQGRSHPIVLSFVVWPAILIAFILTDRTLRAVRAASLSPWLRLSVAPIVLFGALMSVLAAISAPHFLRMAEDSVKLFFEVPRGEYARNLEFIASTLEDGDSVAILDQGQSVYLGELNVPSAIGGPGISELLLVEDLENQLRELLGTPVDHVFAKLGSDGNIPKEYASLLTKYEIVGKSGGGLAHLVPKRGVDAAGEGR